MRIGERPFYFMQDVDEDDDDDEYYMQEEGEGEGERQGELSDDDVEMGEAEGEGERDGDSDLDHLTYRFAELTWIYDETIKHEERRYAAYLEQRTVHTPEYYYNLHGKTSEGSTAAEKGERRYRLFVYLIFSRLKYRLRKFQIEFTNLIIQSMAEKVIGPEAWKIIGQRIMREFGWKKVPPKIVAGAAPRRFGKTVVVATIQCAFAILMGGKEQSTFSTGARASGSIRNYVRNTLIESGFGHLLLTRGANNETLKIETLYKGEQPSILNFFPANGLIRIPPPSLSPPSLSSFVSAPGRVLYVRLLSPPFFA